MSTKISLKHHSDEAAGGGSFHLYRDCFDEDDQFVYLELEGVPFEASTSVYLSGKGLNRVAVRLPNEWALKLGLIDRRPAAHGKENMNESSGKSDPLAISRDLREGKRWWRVRTEAMRKLSRNLASS